MKAGRVFIKKRGKIKRGILLRCTTAAGPSSSLSALRAFKEGELHWDWWSAKWFWRVMAIVGLFKNKRLTHFAFFLFFFFFSRLPSLHLKLSAPNSVAAIHVNMHNWSSLFAQVPTPHNGWIMEEHFRRRCSLFITLLSVTLSQSKGREQSARSCSPKGDRCRFLH